MICNHCKCEINPDVHGCWSLPKGAGIETVCMACATTPAPPRLEPRSGIVLIDKDGREWPLPDAVTQASPRKSTN